MNDDVVVNENKVELTINSDLYPEEVINKAIEEYSEVCEVEDRKNEQIHKVILKPKQVVDSKEDLEIIGYEFMNYLLYLIKNKVL
ncbi:MAG: HxsD-like protein [Candidatus Aenigmarchaeota archaeon]|nr:HxsD-like protein [Candidatus Aenigmarchaeota archaeon]